MFTAHGPEHELVADPRFPNLPASQSLHVLLLEAPRSVEYLPAAQLMHAVEVGAAEVVEYLPAHRPL